MTVAGGNTHGSFTMNSTPQFVFPFLCIDVDVAQYCSPRSLTSSVPSLFLFPTNNPLVECVRFNLSDKRVQMKGKDGERDD